MALKVSGWSGKFLEGLKSSWMVLKVSRLILVFQRQMGTLSRVSEWPRKFPNGLESFPMVLEVF